MKGLSVFNESPYIKKILAKQCSIIKVDPETIDFMTQSWFSEHEWTLKQEGNFIKWLVLFFKKNAKARKELLVVTSPRIKHLKECALMYVFMYGWKTKDAE